MKRMLCTSLALLMSGVQAMADDLPKSLFGVALGEVYSTSGDTFENHTFPVDKLTGASKFLGEGMHLYFKPKQENPAFPYKALSPEDDSPYHKTSHHLYVLPVIPEGIDSLEAYQALDKHEWMVVSIDWYERSQEEDAGYYMTLKNWCDMFSNDLGMEPEIIDTPGEFEYTCTFKQGHVEFELGNFIGPRVVLHFTQKHIDMLEGAVRDRLNAIVIDKIRPYSR